MKLEGEGITQLQVKELASLKKLLQKAPWLDAIILNLCLPRGSISTCGTFEKRNRVKNGRAASCGSLGEFTDIKMSEEGYAMTRQMKNFNFPVRNLDGTFYAQVYPFDPSFFAVKVHPSGALLFTPHHSQLTLLQHIIRQAPFLKKPVQFLDDTPKYWLEDDGTMCLHPSHRWKSDDTLAWLRKRGLHSVPDSIKAEIGDLVYNGPKRNDASTFYLAPWAFCIFHWRTSLK